MFLPMCVVSGLPPDLGAQPRAWYVVDHLPKCLPTGGEVFHLLASLEGIISDEETESWERR